MSAVPTVHLNGTSKNELMKQLTEALGALQVAEKALQEAWPHGRDYYVQPGDTYRLADAQAKDRFARLHSVYTELEAITIEVFNQPDLFKGEPK